MPINDLAAFTLFKAAEDGDPNARAALTSVGPAMYASMETNKDEIKAPPIQGQALSSITPEQAQGIGISPAGPAPAASPAPAPTAAAPEQKQGGIKGWFNEHTTPEGRRYALTSLGQIAGTLAAGAMGGDAAAAGFGKGYGAVTAEDHAQRQAESMRRDQKVWNDQWEQAKQLGPEVLNDPKFSELAQAYQAMQKDFQQGNVSNLKSSTAFMTAMARFKDDLDKVQQQKALETQKNQLIGDAMNKSQANAALMQKMNEILAMPETFTPQDQAMRQQAKAFLATIPQEREIADPNDPSKSIKAVLTDEEYVKHQKEMAAIAERLNEHKLDNERERARDASQERRWNAEIGMRGRELEETRKWRETQYGERQRAGEARVAAHTVNQAVNDAAADLAKTDPDFASMPAAAQRATAQQKVFQDPQMQQQLARGVGAVLQKDNKTGRTGYVVNGKFYTIDGPDMMRTMQLFHQMLAGGQGEGF